MRRFETSIKELVQAQNKYTQLHGKSPIFLSNWDANFSEITIPTLDLSFTKEEAHQYYYWTDENYNRSNFINYIKDKNDIIIPDGKLALASNGTAALFASIMALKEMGVKHFMVFSPVYFTLLSTLDYFDLDCTVYPIAFDKKEINYNEILSLAKKEKIDAFVLTNPIFGTGLELDGDVISKFSEIANATNSWFIMDYIYGGMNWCVQDTQSYIFNIECYKAITKTCKYVLIESISKRIFLNGLKFALLFSDEKLIRRILRLSVFSIGSMSVLQAKIARNIYDDSNIPYIIDHIRNNIYIAQTNFSMLETLLSNSKIRMTQTNCGYFTLLSAPYTCKINNDIDFAVNLIEKYGIMITPHSRYLYQRSGYYSFRVNLLLERQELLGGIRTIIDLLEK